MEVEGADLDDDQIRDGDTEALYISETSEHGGSATKNLQRPGMRTDLDSDSKVKEDRRSLSEGEHADLHPSITTEASSASCETVRTLQERGD